ncbi:MAG TPA: hypothetical protein VIM65_11700 [Cyclobacteriaceae bacterium]
MKTKTAITFAFLFSISAMVKSQSTSGLKETSPAFVNPNMMYASAGTIINESSNSKDSTNPTYRKVGNTRYLVLNPAGETHLYQLGSLYYFSRGMGKVQKLTLKNLKHAFAGDLQFHEALDAEFKSDKELTNRESLPRLAALFEIQEESSLPVARTIGQN